MCSNEQKFSKGWFWSICLLKSLVLFEPFDQIMYPKSSLEMPMMPELPNLLLFTMPMKSNIQSH